MISKALYLIGAVIHFISSHGPDFGQIISIAGQAALACYILIQMNKMPYGSGMYSYWYIFVNRIRYIHLIGFKNWYNQFTKKGTHAELEYSPYNESYLWLKSAPIYYAYFIIFWSSVGLIFGLCHQYGLNQVYTKPKDFFWASPLKNFSIYYAISCFVAELAVKDKTIKMLRQFIELLKSTIEKLKHRNRELEQRVAELEEERQSNN